MRLLRRARPPCPLRPPAPIPAPRMPATLPPRLALSTQAQVLEEDKQAKREQAWTVRDTPGVSRIPSTDHWFSISKPRLIAASAPRALGAPMKPWGHGTGSGGRPATGPSLAPLPLASSTQDSLTTGPPAKATITSLDAKLCGSWTGGPAELCAWLPGRSETALAFIHHPASDG